jgi:hypothetical protein
MRNFYAVFHNDAGLRLTLVFRHRTWCGIEDAARAALAAQSEHDRHGPWAIHAIDVHA